MLKKGTKNTKKPTFETHSRNRMIKGHTLWQSQPKKVGQSVNPASLDEISRGKTVVEPIEENGLVIGVIHHCHCGDTTEIRFEFKNPNRSR